MSFRFAQVSLDQSIGKNLEYCIPQELYNVALPGSRVLIPLKNKLKKGTILTTYTTRITPQEKIVYPIAQVLSQKSLLPPDLLKLATWMAHYYISPINKVLASILPSSLRKTEQEEMFFLLQTNWSQKKIIEYAREIRANKPRQAEILDALLRNPKGLSSLEIQTAKFSTLSIKALLNKGIIKKNVPFLECLDQDKVTFVPTTPKSLTGEQKQAVQEIQTSLSQNTFHTYLIHGITGSGKTEIYLHSIAHALSLNKTVILLVPEVSLIAQMMEILHSRFPHQKIGTIHHRLSHKERFHMWHQMLIGNISISIGARSAIFSPLPSIGLIIVDEEHENTYKQCEETPCYHAKDLAVMRGKIIQATVVLGSATPSAESYANAIKKKYRLYRLCTRPSGHLPNIHIVNMQSEKKGSRSLFSSLLLEKIQKNLSVKEQTILFLNRRGYYTCQICTYCFNTIHCHQCDMSLTYHKGLHILACHICGFTKDPSSIVNCPYCQKGETLRYKGPGTEQIERTLHILFPKVRTLRMDRDTTKNHGSHNFIFQSFRAKQADILIGTQMISKGFHFPAVSLVGILGIDASLYIPDFRSNEKIFQLITQLSGRAGRSYTQGEVVIQSFCSHNPIIQLAAKQDYQAFIQQEILERKDFFYPPFSKLIKIIFSGTCCKQVEQFAHECHLLLKKESPPSILLHPILPCEKTKIKNKYRFQCLLRGENLFPLYAILHSLLQKKQKNIRLLIDVNPIDTLSS